MSNKVKKVVIPFAGPVIRMLPAKKTIPKKTLSIARKPICFRKIYI
tara:strand:+ start:39 stop:176 length:138 start_codon:yes stop_codon:yes gene_type:complete